MGEINERLENKLTHGLTDIVRREVRSLIQFGSVDRSDRDFKEKNLTEI